MDVMSQLLSRQIRNEVEVEVEDSFAHGSARCRLSCNEIGVHVGRHWSKSDGSPCKSQQHWVMEDVR